MAASAAITSSSSLDGLLVAAGLYRPARDQLERYRAAIGSDRIATRFEAAVAVAAADGLTLAEPGLKRAPRGYPVDHPRIDRLRMKELIVHRRHDLEPWLHQPACDTRLRRELEASRPLVEWLGEYVGPPQHTNQ